MTHVVFVYGSLKRGGENHATLAGTELIGPDRTRFPIYDLVSFRSFPGMVSGNSHVAGEIYRVSEDTLGRLDALENNGMLYSRQPLRMENFPRVVFAYTLMAAFRDMASPADSARITFDPDTNTKTWVV